MHLELEKEEFRIKMTQQLIIAHAKYDDKPYTLTTLHTEDSNIDDRFLFTSGDRRISTKRMSLKERTERRLSAKSKNSKNTDGMSYHFDIAMINETIESHVKEWFPDDAEQASLKTRESTISYLGYPVDWKVELMTIPFAPKHPLSSFARSGCKIFLSKKKPLLIIANLASHEEVERALKEHEARLLHFDRSQYC